MSKQRSVIRNEDEVGGREREREQFSVASSREMKLSIGRRTLQMSSSRMVDTASRWLTELSILNFNYLPHSYSI